MTAAPPDESSPAPLQSLQWVRIRDGKPYVAWGRLAAAAILFLGLTGATQLAMSAVLGSPIRLPMVVVLFCGFAAYLVTVVELQRQAVINSRTPKFQISLAGLFWLTAVASLFFAVVGHMIADTQRAFAVNKALTKELELALGKGSIVAMGEGDARRISCHTTRADFDDDDLLKVIHISELEGRRASELTHLAIETTSVTDVGIRELRRCHKLHFLAIPSMALSGEAIEAIGACNRLAFLSCDERKLTAAQIARLRELLPQVRFNGRSWQDRDIKTRNGD